MYLGYFKSHGITLFDQSKPPQIMGLRWSAFYANLQARAASILKINFKKLWKKNNVLHTGMQGYYSKFKHWNFRKT